MGKHPLHLLRAMGVVETPSSRRSEACHVTCHVKFGVSCQIIPQLILTRGRLIQSAAILSKVLVSVNLLIYRRRCSSLLVNTQGLESFEKCKLPIIYCRGKEEVEDEEKQLEEAREVFYSRAPCS